MAVSPSNRVGRCCHVAAAPPFWPRGFSAGDGGCGAGGAGAAGAAAGPAPGQQVRRPGAAEGEGSAEGRAGGLPPADTPSPAAACLAASPPAPPARPRALPCGDSPAARAAVAAASSPAPRPGRASPVSASAAHPGAASASPGAGFHLRSPSPSPPSAAAAGPRCSLTASGNLCPWTEGYRVALEEWWLGTGLSLRYRPFPCFLPVLVRVILLLVPLNPWKQMRVWYQKCTVWGTVPFKRFALLK